MLDKSEKYEVIELLNNTALFTTIRIANKDVPKWLYKYDLRHADDDGITACEVSKLVMVNHYGTILTNKPIRMIHGSCTMFDEDKCMQFTNQHLTISEYQKKFKSQAKKTYKNMCR